MGLLLLLSACDKGRSRKQHRESRVDTTASSQSRIDLSDSGSALRARAGVEDSPTTWPCVSVVDSVPDSPATISEKKMPMDRAVPEFWNVERIPEAAPRWCAGTLLMIADELGEENIPTPSPFAVMSTANQA